MCLIKERRTRTDSFRNRNRSNRIFFHVCWRTWNVLVQKTQKTQKSLTLLWITSPKSSHTVLKTKRSLYSFTYVGVITHECVVCSNKADTAKRTAPFWNVWLLGIVSLTFAEMQLLVIAQGSAGLTSEKRWAVMRAWSLCGGPFWTPLYLNQVCFISKTAMICS